MIKVFKMINGEEIISKATATELGYDLESPATIMIQQTESGNMGVGIAPYMPYATGSVLIHRTAIAAEGTPDIKMENEYNRVFGSGIQIASAGGIIGG